jgi:hypothetical protein
VLLLNRSAETDCVVDLRLPSRPTRLSAHRIADSDPLADNLGDDRVRVVASKVDNGSAIGLGAHSILLVETGGR